MNLNRLLLMGHRGLEQFTITFAVPMPQVSKVGIVGIEVQ